MQLVRKSAPLNLGFTAIVTVALFGCATPAHRTEPSIADRHPGSVALAESRRTILSPDGHTLYFDHRTSDAPADIWKLDLAPEARHAVANKFASGAQSLAIQEISPDGKTLALLTTDAKGLDTGLILQPTDGSASDEVVPLLAGRSALGAWFDNGDTNLYYLVTSTEEQQSWFFRYDLQTKTKTLLFVSRGLVKELDQWGDGLFLFRPEGEGLNAPILVWLGEDTGVMEFKPTWLATAKEIRFGDRPDEFLVLMTDGDGVNRLYDALENRLQRISDRDVNVDQFLIDHRRFRLYLTRHEKKGTAVDILDAKNYLPYSIKDLPQEHGDWVLDRTSRYGRFFSFFLGSKYYIYDWRDSELRDFELPTVAP